MSIDLNTFISNEVCIKVFFYINKKNKINCFNKYNLINFKMIYNLKRKIVINNLAKR